MQKIDSHKDLRVWQESMDLVVSVYRLTDLFPQKERFSLTDQMRRAAVSIPSNIAEGAGRKSKKEWIYFLHVSLGSLAELETQLEISRRLNYIAETKQLMEKIKFIRIMLSQLIKRLKAP